MHRWFHSHFGYDADLQARQQREVKGFYVLARERANTECIWMSETSELHQDPESLVQRYMERPREDLKDSIIVQYAPMVERIARRFSGLEPLEDLVQVGFVGLLNALSKFDPQARVGFNTYATSLVPGELKHELRHR